MADIVQSMWVGPRLSVMEQLCIKSYLYHGHPFHLYVYQKTDGVPAGTTVLDGTTIVPASRIFTVQNHAFGHGSLGGFADVFRYNLLLRKGNWWVDLDSVCLKPFDFGDEYVISSEMNKLGFQMNNGYLKAPSGSLIYQWLEEQSRSIGPNMQWGASGPRLMERAVAKFDLYQYVQHAEVFCPVDYSNNCELLINPAPWNFGPETYAVHLWHEAWRSRKIDKNKVYHPDCLYEQLKRRYL